MGAYKFHKAGGECSRFKKSTHNITRDPVNCGDIRYSATYAVYSTTYVGIYADWESLWG